MRTAADTHYGDDPAVTPITRTCLTVDDQPVQVDGFAIVRADQRMFLALDLPGLGWSVCAPEPSNGHYQVAKFGGERALDLGSADRAIHTVIGDPAGRTSLIAAAAGR